MNQTTELALVNDYKVYEVLNALPFTKEEWQKIEQFTLKIQDF